MNTLFAMIYNYRIQDLQEALEKKDDNGLGENVRQIEEVLFAELNEQQINQVQRLKIAIQDRYNEINYDLQVFLTNFVLRMGMEIQRSVDEEELKHD